MRILSVAGENLASLRDPFRIDFDKPPLADAGLFVITGRTGAGKSTLLDAICLALYNRIPRLRGKKDLSNKVEDLPGGELLSDNDPRQILRRGATAASASVRFQGLDGKRYCSTWHVHRANKRPTGKLQESELTLVNETEQRVELNGRSYKEEYTARITQLVGMNYEQFVRAVVLAQSQFDAFLKAPADEKASLLEQLTNTREFALISRTIFSRCAAARSDLEHTELEIEALGCLSLEEIATLETQQNVYQENVTRAQHDVNQLARSIEWHEQARNMHQEVLAAQELVKQQEAESEKIENQKAWVNQWEESQEVREKAVRVQESQEQIHKLIAALRAKSTTLQHAYKEGRRLEKEYEQLLHTRELLAGERVNLEHIQTSSLGIEKEIAAQTAEFERLDAKLKELCAQGKRAAEEEKEQEKKLKQLQTQIEQRDRVRAALAPRQKLYEALERLQQIYTSFTDLLPQILREQKDLALATNIQARLLQQQAEIEKEWHALAGGVPLEVLELRALLKEGTPCPLCGSTTHHLEPEATALHAQDWETLRSEQQRLKQLREKVDKDLHTAEVNREKHRAALTLLEQQKKQAETLWEQTLREQQTLPHVAIQETEFTQEQLPAIELFLTNLVTERTQWLEIEKAAGLEAQLASSRELFQSREQTTQRLREEYRGLSQQHDDIQTKIEELRKQLSDLTQGKPLEQLMRDYHQRFRNNDLRITEVKRRLGEVHEQQQNLAQTTHTLNHNRCESQRKQATTQSEIETWLREHPAYNPALLATLQGHTKEEVNRFRERWNVILQETTKAQTLLQERMGRKEAHLAAPPPDPRPLDLLTQALSDQKKCLEENQKLVAYHTLRLEEQAQKAKKRVTLEEIRTQQRDQALEWEKLNALFGSKDGKRFRVIAQGYTLVALLEFANRQLAHIMPRYRLEQGATEGNTLSLRIVDTQMGGEIRNIDTLSGGETFIVSLALSLALSSISSHHHAIELLFIDEGFGTLDADNLRLVIETLEALQMQGRRIGLISHVAELNERIPVQVRVEKQSHDAARVFVVG